MSSRKRFRNRLYLAQFAVSLIAMCVSPFVWSWGQEGHSIVAEIAQRRLTPNATMELAGTLGAGTSMASVASWADDVRDSRPETASWHYVDIPIADDKYDRALECKPSTSGDCIVEELTRLRIQLRCGVSAQDRLDALKFAIHFIGDIHQPLHTVNDFKGGTALSIAVIMRGLTCTGHCQPAQSSTNLHALWDSGLIQKTVWDWGAMVDRLENGWLKSAEAATPGIDGGTPKEWAEETHHLAQAVWKMTPENHQVDDVYFSAALPLLDRQLGVAGLRLARFLNEAYASRTCPAA
ncbi:MULTISPECIES: S1/P1 nuclease [unclassified Caballeronia]|uniref:S1/P1 nuclease n=1 Tax=unclassified Caballeronia TaxID=2646786 RepID=UPI0020290481|nr:MULTISPECIES: S1/P1 nuclease [unclassified Caballeronia]